MMNLKHQTQLNISKELGSIHSLGLGRQISTDRVNDRMLQR